MLHEAIIALKGITFGVGAGEGPGEDPNPQRMSWLGIAKLEPGHDIPKGDRGAGPLARTLNRRDRSAQ